MKKNLFLLVVLLLTAGMTAQAQFKFGLKAGVNLSNVSLSGDGADNVKTENLTGFQVGPTIELMIPIINLGIDASLLYSQQGSKITVDGKKEEFKTNTMEIPLNLKYKISALDIVGVYLAAGPYVSFKLSDNVIDAYKAKSFGAGLNFGLGVELFAHLQVGANYKLGLTDDYGTADAVNIATAAFKGGQQRGWIISAAYFF
jgi:hypothetical protein